MGYEEFGRITPALEERLTNNPEAKAEIVGQLSRLDLTAGVVERTVTNEETQ